MHNYQHILVAVNPMNNTQAALTQAYRLSEQCNAKISAAYVLPPDLTTTAAYAYAFSPEVEAAATAIEEEADKNLSELQKAFPKLAGYLLKGHIAEAIIKLGEELKVDLIVTGSHGKNGIRALLGSTAISILNQADCDVLVIRSKTSSEEKPKAQDYKQLLIASDFSEGNDKLYARASELSQLFNSEKQLIYVIPNQAIALPLYSIDLTQELKTEAKLQMHQLCEKLKIDEATHTHIRQGYPSTTIPEIAIDLQADLIILGKHQRHFVKRLFLGATANGVLHHANTDVLVVKL